MNRFPLYELHDIQPGPSLSTELTAPLLVVAGLLLLGLLCAWQLRRHARRKPVRRARRELAALSGSQPDLALRLNTWLKSTVITSYSIHYTKLYDQHDFPGDVGGLRHLDHLAKYQQVHQLRIEVAAQQQLGSYNFV